MNKKYLVFLVLASAFTAGAVDVWDESRAVTFANRWFVPATADADASIDAEMELDLRKTDQTMLGFGTAVSEMSYDALQWLSVEDRKAVLDEMYGPSGAGFTVVRTPIGSSDFSREYYSYDDVDGDYKQEKFSLEIDERALLPLLREIKSRVKPEDFRIWASPWSPPKWMKKSGSYASCPPWASNLPENDCPIEKIVHIGEDGFICDRAHYLAYALYFRKYVDAMEAKGLKLWMVMPQNEPSSAQPYPSCTWRGRSLAEFTVDYLGPALEGSGTQLYMGTVEERSVEKVHDVFARENARKYVKGAGFQWEGHGAIGATHRRYPDLPLVMTEQECCNGENSWTDARHFWKVARRFIGQGAGVYNYWNLALTDEGRSHWGWPQNSLVTVDRKTRKVTYNVDYYLMKLLSSNIRLGSKRFFTRGDLEDLGFVDADGKSFVVFFANWSDVTKRIAVKVNSKHYIAELTPNSVAAFRGRTE